MTVDYRIGDSREVVAGIPDGSVDLIASSPPFLALRSYLPADHESKAAEIGSEANPAAFIDTLLALTAEWGRVLAPHGSIAIELGDTYSGSGGAGGDYGPSGLRGGQQMFDGSANRSKRPAQWGTETGPPRRVVTDAWLRPKCMALIPQLYAVALAYGINPLTGAPSPAGRWLVRNVIVWHRPNPAVGALGDKVRPSTSYITVATRSKDRWFDLTAVRTGHARDYTGERPTKPNREADRNGGGRQTTVREFVADPAGAPPLDAWFDEYDGTNDLWNLTTQPSRLAHFAMWPAKLAERLILSMCPAEVCSVCDTPRRRVETSELIRLSGTRGQKADALGNTTTMQRTESRPTTLGWTDCNCAAELLADSLLSDNCDGQSSGFCCAHHERVAGRINTYRPGLVLDPFAGAGTTLAVADIHGRDAIGIDIDARNRDLYPARYDEVKRALFGTAIPDPAQMEMFA